MSQSKQVNKNAPVAQAQNFAPNLLSPKSIASSNQSAKGGGASKTPFNAKQNPGILRNAQKVDTSNTRNKAGHGCPTTYSELFETKKEISIPETGVSTSQDFPEILIRYELVHEAIDTDIIPKANIIFKREYWRARRQQKKQAKYIK